MFIIHTVPLKDTVLISSPVLGWARHVEQDQLGLPRFLHDFTVESESGVHASDIGLISA